MRENLKQVDKVNFNFSLVYSHKILLERAFGKVYVRIQVTYCLPL